MKVYFLKQLILHRSDTRGRNKSQNIEKCLNVKLQTASTLAHLQHPSPFVLVAHAVSAPNSCTPTRHLPLITTPAAYLKSLCTFAPMPMLLVTSCTLSPAHQCTRDCLLPSPFTNLPAWVDAQHTTPTALYPQPCLLHPCLHLPTNQVELPSQLAIRGHK